MKIAIVAGGTGGHLFPAIGFYESVKKNNNGTEVFFIISTRDIQYKKEWDVKTYSLEAVGFPRKVSLSFIKFMIYLLINLVLSFKIMYKEKPDAVIGFGGYVSFAPLVTAIFSGVPVYIHEQNAVPGKVNKVLARFVKKIFVGFNESFKYWAEKFRNKIEFVGIPIRDAAKPKSNSGIFETGDNLFTVLVVGGSQGSLVFNKWIEGILPLLSKYADSVRFIHLCGKHDVAMVEGYYNKFGFRNICFGFYDKMGDIYPVCDIAVCRAGAGTLTELSYCGVPAIAIPYPYATDNHQFHNAKTFEAAGAMDLIEEKDCNPAILAEKIIYYFENRDKLNLMKQLCEKLAERGAGDKMMEAITKDAVLQR